MQIGNMASTLDKKGYGRWGEDTYKKLREHGYTCSYFDMAKTETVLYTAPREEADKILLHEKELAKAAGIEITQVHGPWRWPIQDSTEADRAERLEKMQECIRMTAVLGCKNMVIHPIMPFGMEDMEHRDETWEINLRFMRELLKTAKEYGVTICLENMPMLKFSMATPERILEFVNTINDDNFKVCLDTGHVTVFEEKLSLGDEVRRLGDNIRATHVHDNMFGHDLHLFPYHGIEDWTEFTKALHDINFDGCITLEVIPDRKLPDDLFDDMGKSLAKIADRLRG